MKSKIFTDFLDLISESPNSIKSLRSYILKLAVQGKLVNQKLEYFPPDCYTNKVQYSPLRPSETPFDLPTNWKWERLGNVCSYIQRGKSPNYVDISEYPVISQKCVQWKGFDVSKARYIEPKSIPNYEEERFLKNGDLLWNSTGDGTIGRINIYTNEKHRFKNVVADSHVTVLRLFKLEPRFVFTYIASPYVQSKISELSSGTTKQTELNTSTVKSLPIPVPPIEEQKRIVEKVDQLMTLCDELEARQEKQTHTLRQLNDASLHALFSASSPKEFEKHWKRIIVNFNLLYGDLENLTKLRQAIFDLAFSGKLSKQWRNKQRNENIAVHSNQNVSAANNLYPVGWRLEPLHTIASVGTGATPLTTNPQYYSAGTINWVTSSSTSLPFVTQPDKLITKTAIQETNCKIFPCGTLIVAMYGQGKTRGQISELQIPAATNQALAAIQLHLLDDYHKRYVKYFFQKIYSEIRKLASGGAQPNLNLNIIKSTLIPIPPPDEQKYIADKIEALLCICDALEEKIKTKSAHLETLTASILAH